MTEEYWTTKEGSRIAVSSMTENHVKNVLRMLLRKQREARASEQLMEILLPWEEFSHMPDWEEQFWEDEGRYGTGEK